MKIFQNEGKIEVLDERFYTYTNDKKEVSYFPGSTTILDAYYKGYGFMQWLKDVGQNADEIVKRAGEQGTNIHNAIDLMQTGHKIEFKDYTLIEWQMINRFFEFWQNFNPIKIANETPLVSPTLKFGGTIDLVCIINHERWLIDYKSSNYLHKSNELQIASYAMLWNEHYPDLTIEKTGILWLNANTRGVDSKGKSIQGAGWQLKTYDRQYKDSFKIFLATQTIWEEENPNFKPKNLIYPGSLQIELPEEQ